MEGSIERVERLLALILVKQMPDAGVGERALALNRAGFSPAEIGEILGERPNTISVQVLRARKAAKQRPRRRKG